MNKLNMEKGKQMKWYINTEWKMERKGLRKKVLDFNFKKLEKPHLFGKVVIKIEDVQNLDSRASKYLAFEHVGQEQQLKMGSAITPVDCYVELIVRQMIVGECARCYIATKRSVDSSNSEICFTVTLEQILDTKEIQQLTIPEMVALAQQFKDNGVSMFKEYPLFAHDYFSLAAKCLISYKPFHNLTVKDGVDGNALQMLFTQIQTNLAACLLNEQRYEDVIYQTQFVDTVAEPSEKSVYRRAMAFYHIKQFNNAKRTLERIPNYKEKREFVKLNQLIVESWKSSNDEYKNVMQRMFS